jgi:mTERF domain-containing protein, mitochondrial
LGVVRTNLLPRILFWLDLLGSTSLLMKWLNKKWILKYSVDLLPRNPSTLRGLGIPQARLVGVLRLKPSLIMQTPDRPRALIDPVGMYVWALLALHGVSRAAFRAKNAAVMGGVGCTEQEFLPKFRRAPCFLLFMALRSKGVDIGKESCST